MSTSATLVYLKKVKAEVAHEKAKASLARAKVRLAKTAENLQTAMIAVRPNAAEDYRIVIGHDDSWGWASDKAMLDDVLGDGYSAEDAAPWLAAWNGGGGVYTWHVRLELRNRVTEEYETEDSCGGFYSYNECAPRDAMIEMVKPAGIEGDIEIVYE